MAFMRNNNNNNNNRRHNNNHHRPRHSGQGYQGGQGQQNQGNGPRRHVNRANQVFESNGPEGRVRGTAQQIVEKYTVMGRDAAISGDKVLSMNYFQHAEHYQRLANEIMEETAAFEREREQTRQQQTPQPDMAAQEAGEGFSPNDQQREQPRQDRRERDDQQRPQRSSQRRSDHEDEEGENALPSFLQVPITETPPPPRARRSAEGREEEAENAAPQDDRPARTSRPRRAAAPEENPD